VQHTAQLLGPVLKVRDVRLTPLVGHGVVPAPLGGDPPEVAARVLSLRVVAHVCLCGVIVVVEGKPGLCVERREVVQGDGLVLWTKSK
jgi:hypothetical protein